MSTAEWISAFGGVGQATGGFVAVGVAIWAVTTSRRQTDELAQREAARDEAQEQRQMEAQARLVSVWVETATDDPSRWVLKLRNASDAPVFGVRCDADYHHPDGWSESPVFEEPVEVYVLPPGLTERPFGTAWDRADLGRVVVEIGYRDTNGQRWHRDFDGRLTPVGGPGQPWDHLDPNSEPPDIKIVIKDETAEEANQNAG
jgi:hypothetical protein